MNHIPKCPPFFYKVQIDTRTLKKVKYTSNTTTLIYRFDENPIYFSQVEEYSFTTGVWS